MSSFNPKTVARPGLFSRLQRGFSPSRWLRSPEGLTRLSDGGGRPEWVLTRGLCAYTTLDGHSVPARRRAGFAQMAVSRWSPFADTQSHVEWVGDRAMVWAWSRERVLAGADGELLPMPRRILPESLFRGQALAGGEDLVGLEQGFEGRVWQAGMLTASRWWDAVPELDAWNDFRRGAGLAPAAYVPTAVSAPLASSPWGPRGNRGMGELVSQQRGLLAALAVGLATAFLAAPLVAGVALKVSIWQLQEDIAAREAAIAPILAAREAALADAKAVDALLRMRPPAGQTSLMAAVIGLIPGRWQLLKWHMPDADHLQVTLRMPAVDPRTIVQAWEKSGRFAEVTAEVVRQPDQVQIDARILRTGAGS